MNITWYGHSCFLLQSDAGVGILTDPCDPATGYTLHDIPADAITISHDHHDHNYAAAAAGNPVIITSPGTHSVHGVTITGFSSWHDDAQGQARGANILFLIEIDGVRVLHLGDLGHLLDEDTVKAIGKVDVLLCPIGGKYTIDAEQAVETAELIQPRVFIPMHYATPSLQFSVAGLDEWAKRVKDRNVHRLNSNTCSISPETLGEKRILILNYRK